MKSRPIAVLSLVLCLLAPAGAFAPAPEDAAALVAEMKKSRDEADPKLIQDLAALKSREALDGLIDLYDTTFGSIYMRREVVKVLGGFDSVTELQQPALQKLADVATGSKEPELRAMAIDTLAECRFLGKHFLKTVVESGAEDGIRERAMEKVVQLSGPDDKDFFQRVFESVEDKSKEKDKDKKDKRKKDGEAEPERKPHSLKAVREMAFEQIAGDMKPEQLMEHARDKEKDAEDVEKWGVRRLALLELEKRKDKGLYDLATVFYEDATERAENRAEAVRILAEHDGVKIAPRFLKDGRGNEAAMPELVRMAIADQLAKMRDEDTDKALLKLVGDGKPHERRFVLRALRGVRDEKLAKSLLKEIAAGTKKGPPEENDPKYNDERDLVLAMIETVATLGDDGAKVELQKLATSGKDPVIVAAAMNAVGELSRNDPAWLASIETAAASPQPEVRNAALATLGKTGDKKFLPVLVKALDSDDWSTRYTALDALKGIRAQETIAALVGRVEKEHGLMLVRFADVLWNLTGKPFRLSGAAWKSWWDKEGATFQPISLAELAKIEADEEARRLKQTTKAATFFGIRIVSHRVIFILDVSGSMLIELDSEYVGRRGRPRIDVAKEELVKAIDGLDSQALFNVIVFSSDVDSWLEGGMAESATATAREQGKQFVQALGAGGATNLYDALRLAFADGNCDTIIVLSDGEPNAGEESDPAIIRERVKQWNEHRGVVIHTIAVGGTFHVLEWLAQDSGGNHKKFQ